MPAAIDGTVILPPYDSAAKAMIAYFNDEHVVYELRGQFIPSRREQK